MSPSDTLAGGGGSRKLDHDATHLVPAALRLQRDEHRSLRVALYDGQSSTTTSVAKRLRPLSRDA